MLIGLHGGTITILVAYIVLVDDRLDGKFIDRSQIWIAQEVIFQARLGWQLLGRV